MDEALRKELAEKIAEGFASGLNNDEIVGVVEGSFIEQHSRLYIVTKADLVAVIRDLMMMHPVELDKLTKKTLGI